MNSYEVLYIIDNDAQEEQREELVKTYSDLVTNSGGTVETVDKWGTKKFAYPINFKTEGFYVLMNFTSSPDIPAEMERIMKINDSIVRCMIIKK